MEEVPCCHCGWFFQRSPRHKNQNYCLKPDCRKAKKAAWKREKIRTDPDFKLACQLSNQKWARDNSHYWKKYRRRNPEKTERNRQLQILRNRLRRKESPQNPTPGVTMIAKVDASISNKFNPIGQYYLVPVIAKVDPLKVRIYEISTPYQ
jgi:hypothetical protein